jgi:hypothetical protein
MTGTVASSSRDRDTEYRCSTRPGSAASPNSANVSVARFLTGVPVMPKYRAFGSAPRSCPARDSSRSDWVRCASSTITMMLSRTDRFFPASANLWTVVAMTPRTSSASRARSSWLVFGSWK